jgi:hypothetical protein
MGLTGAKIATLNPPSPITITSAGNDSGITFAIVGTVASGGNPGVGVLTETVTGSNTSIVASKNSYTTIISVTPSGNTASTVTVGAMGFATVSVARRIIFTSGGNDQGITFTISGTDWAGTSISEAVTGSNGGVASTILDYKTVTSVQTSGATASTITVGTNGIAGSPWLNLDTWGMGTASIQAVVTGTANYTIQVSNDDPDSYGNPVARSSVTWDSDFAGIQNAAASTMGLFSQVPAWVRILLNSGTGSVALTVIQHLDVTL